MNTTMPHQGRAVKRIREILGIKQDALAIDLGLTQQAVSLMEQKEVLDAPMLQKVADVLKVPKEAIESYSDENAINLVQNNYEGASNNSNIDNYNYQCSFNPLDKVMELVEDNKRLYERLLQAEKEKAEMLERLLKERK